jgi:HK97 gp10 family phage protein
VSKAVVSWNQAALVAKVSGRVLSGMDRACAFAAGQAKSKAPRATGNLASEIAYEVVPTRNTITGWVGVKKGDAFYGYFQELGTRRSPAHPFLRPAVFGNAAQIVKLIAGG